jgi:uncharacterized paraquat-inducible protein A
MFLAMPACLSLLAMAAHFLRRGNWAGVAVCLGLILVMAIPRAWAMWTVQIALLLAALLWVRTMVAIVDAREAMGMPWGKAVVILGAVVVFTLVSAGLFRTRTLWGYYHRRR